jgi:hypothetical protein
VASNQVGCIRVGVRIYHSGLQGVLPEDPTRFLRTVKVEPCNIPPCAVFGCQVGTRSWPCRGWRPVNCVFAIFAIWYHVASGLIRRRFGVRLGSGHLSLILLWNRDVSMFYAILALIIDV